MLVIVLLLVVLYVRVVCGVCVVVWVCGGMCVCQYDGVCVVVCARMCAGGICILLICVCVVGCV